MSENDNKKPNIPPSLNISALIKTAEETYTKLKEEIEPSQNGKYIAIEPESGEYFIGDTREEAVAKVKEKYPTRIPLTRRIGELEKASRHIFRNNKYLRHDRVF